MLTSPQIQKYTLRVSSSLLDLAYIHTEAPAVKFKELSGKASGEASEGIRQCVE
ncbi:MAG: hypothetical protein O7G31_04045 [Calditrichaeota bacterium]|nr:hypothetical protein [Calditrichota bacterium]